MNVVLKLRPLIKFTDRFKGDLAGLAYVHANFKDFYVSASGLNRVLRLKLPGRFFVRTNFIRGDLTYHVDILIVTII